MKLKRRKNSGKIRKKTEIKKTSFLKEKPGLAVALAAGIIVSALFIFSLVYSAPINTEELLYAQQIFEENQLIIDGYIQQIDAEIAADPANMPDNYYFYSLKSDFEWLKGKELAAYNSPAKSDIYLKEISFNLFLEVITETNYNIAIEAGEPNYEATISSAVQKEAPVLELFKESDFEGEANPREYAAKGNAIFNQLLRDYVSEKRLLATGGEPIERRYIEAKKISNISEIDLGYLDENYEEY